MNQITFAQLVDLEQLRRLLEAHYRVTGILSAILDNDENILVAVGWQDICTRFHRVHGESSARCRESDARIKERLRDYRGGYVDYRCGNGLRDVAVPIIIEGEHLATLFTGQFFYDDEKPDPEFFRRQAAEFGFDEAEYLAALERVPVRSRGEIRDIMDYYVNLVNFVVDLSLKNLRLADQVRERRKAEQALRESRDYLGRLFDAIPDLLLVIDRDLRVRKSNWHGGYEHIDTSVRERMPHCYEAFYPGKATPCGSCPALEVFATGRSVAREKFSPKTNRQLEIRAYPVFDETGEVAMVVEHVRDVTEQKKAQQALLDSEERYRTLFETMREGFALHEVILDRDGRPHDYRFLDINPAFERSLGMERSRVIGRTVGGLLPNIEPSWIETYGQVALSGEPGRFEGYSADLGRHFEVNVYSPRPGQLAAVFSDVTERRRLQEELVKGQRLESLGVLAGGIAHDFNNILTVISGNLSLVRMMLPEDHKARERIARCEKAVKQATGLTCQLLTFARGGDPLRRVIDPRHVVMDSVSFSLRGSNVANELEISPDLWSVEADEGQIGQVLNNLLINADQAMSHGGTVRVEACNATLAEGEVPQLPEGRYVRISVTDHGRGIPPKHLDKIFDPYFTTKESGTGLGLTSVYSIIRKHDGQIVVSSQMGKGSTFRVFLPACPAGGEGGAASPSRPILRGRGRVLVMDDEEIIREMAREMLSLLGYQAETCSNGEEAIGIYRMGMDRGARPDAVIIDLTIPGKMGGLEAASRILSIDPSAVLIVSSGYSSDPVMANYRDYGFADALAKPFKVEDLSSSLHGLLDGQARPQG